MEPRVALILILASYLVLCKAQVSVQKCIENPGMSNFDISSFSGNWMEMKRFPNSYEGDNEECVTAQFNAVGGENMTHFKTKIFLGFDPEEVQNQMQQDNPPIIYTALQTKENYANRIATFKIKFEKPDGYADSSISVADADYENYAVVYACRQLGRGSRKTYSLFLWILSKGTKLNPDSEEKVSMFLKQHDIPQKELEDVGKSCYSRQ